MTNYLEVKVEKGWEDTSSALIYYTEVEACIKAKKKKLTLVRNVLEALTDIVNKSYRNAKVKMYYRI